METKEFKIVIPDGMEIDVENSTFECIRFKVKQVKTWDNLGKIDGYFIREDSLICTIGTVDTYSMNKNTAISEKHCKAMLAMAQISQLMPHYGGAITDGEWKDGSSSKYIISRVKDYIVKDCFTNSYEFLAFHTDEQRDEFLENNEQLVKDYLMIE